MTTQQILKEELQDSKNPLIQLLIAIIPNIIDKILDRKLSLTKQKQIELQQQLKSYRTELQRLTIYSKPRPSQFWELETQFQKIEDSIKELWIK